MREVPRCRNQARQTPRWRRDGTTRGRLGGGRESAMRSSILPPGPNAPESSERRKVPQRDRERHATLTADTTLVAEGGASAREIRGAAGRPRLHAVLGAPSGASRGRARRPRVDGRPLPSPLPRRRPGAPSSYTELPAESTGKGRSW